MACELVKLIVPTEVSKYNNIPSIKEKKMAFIENVIAPKSTILKLFLIDFRKY